MNALDKPIPSADAYRELLFEAASLDDQYGPNAYSDYLRKHGCRPDRATAATIGKLLGGRVQADDGKMYPRPTVAERKAKKARQDEFDVGERMRNLLLNFVVPFLGKPRASVNDNTPRGGAPR